jgi:hypothetical protein
MWSPLHNDSDGTNWRDEGRDKKNLSKPESPVFMRVLRDLLRDEGFLSL